MDGWLGNEIQLTELKRWDGISKMEFMELTDRDYWIFSRVGVIDRRKWNELNGIKCME